MPQGTTQFPIIQPDMDRLRDCRAKGLKYLVLSIPWAMIEPHAEQADKNHYQSLARLADRGGLSACEALAVLEDRPHSRLPEPVAQHRLQAEIKEWEAKQS